MKLTFVWKFVLKYKILLFCFKCYNLHRARLGLKFSPGQIQPRSKYFAGITFFCYNKKEDILKNNVTKPFWLPFTYTVWKKRRPKRHICTVLIIAGETDPAQLLSEAGACSVLSGSSVLSQFWSICLLQFHTR